jgi:hypothetical protein
MALARILKGPVNSGFWRSAVCPLFLVASPLAAAPAQPAHQRLDVGGEGQPRHLIHGGAQVGVLSAASRKPEVVRNCPVTGSNWQGIGVAPDIAVAPERAYDVAYAKARRRVLDLDDVPPPITDEAGETLASLCSSVSHRSPPRPSENRVVDNVLR